MDTNVSCVDAMLGIDLFISFTLNISGSCLSLVSLRCSRKLVRVLFGIVVFFIHYFISLE